MASSSNNLTKHCLDGELLRVRHLSPIMDAPGVWHKPDAADRGRPAEKLVT